MTMLTVIMVMHDDDHEGVDDDDFYGVEGDYDSHDNDDNACHDDDDNKTSNIYIILRQGCLKCLFTLRSL